MSERAFYLPSKDAPRARLAVRCENDFGCLVDIADEDVTSDSPNARTLDTPANAVRRLCVTREEAAWIRDALVALDLGPVPTVPELHEPPIDEPIPYTLTEAGETLAALDEACGAVPPPPSEPAS